MHYGQLHKQAQSRQKQLDKIERLERPSMVDVPRMHFPEVTRSGDIVLQVDDLTKSYDRPLFKDLSFQLQRGRRLGIMGPNGCGKTTLLRILLGQEQPTSGAVKRGQLVQLGYYDQHLKTLPEDKPVIRAIWPEGDPDATEQGMRNLLGRFGLTGEQVYQEVGALSGGERSRAALARLAALEVNVLVLDEPTNHLDLWACEALEESLLQFEGTAIVVSHDRFSQSWSISSSSSRTAAPGRARQPDMRTLRRAKAGRPGQGGRSQNGGAIFRQGQKKRHSVSRVRWRPKSRPPDASARTGSAAGSTISTTTAKGQKPCDRGTKFIKQLYEHWKKRSGQVVFPLAQGTHAASARAMSSSTMRSMMRESDGTFTWRTPRY